jgi:hypothetical protein
MPTTPAHAKPAPKDYLWVLAVIAACALIKVSPSWVGIAAAAGFPRFGRMPTDWTLAVIMEAYWAYALYAWLATAAGVRSRRFAMWSASGVFILSLAGQSAARLVGVKPMTAFANGMPVIVLALIAILVHLRQLDRADATAAEDAARRDDRARTEEAAAADERTALRAELDALAAEVEPLRDALAEAQADADRATARADSLAAKLDALKPKRTRAKAANSPANGKRRSPANGKANDPANSPAGTEVPDDIDARSQALGIYLATPKISGKDLGEAVGMTPRWGQLRRAEFAASAPAGPADSSTSKETS